MAERREYHGRGKRIGRRFQPEDQGGELEPRLLLSAGLRPAIAHSHVQVARHPVHAAHPQRITPTAEINREYASFVSDFAQVEAVVYRIAHEPEHGLSNRFRNGNRGLHRGLRANSGG